MRYESAAAFRAAIEARLRDHARLHGEASLTRLRRHIAFDRFLSRLLITDPGHWILKGGLAPDYRLGDKARATRDIDLVHAPDIDRIEDVFDDAVLLDLGDFFRFSVRRANTLDGLIEGSAIRFHVRTTLDGRTFDDFVIDIGFDQPAGIRTEMMQQPGFLKFADLASLEIPVLTIEYHLAEKLHAYSKTYPSGRPNTRVKDMVDIVLIGRAFALNARACRAAIRDTFNVRDTHEIPTSLGRPPARWEITYRSIATSVSLDPDLAVGYAFAKQLLDPLLGGTLGDDANWNTSRAEWT